jgi:hypothetical protein
MTFAVLRSLHTIIGDALDEIQCVYSDGSSDICKNLGSEGADLHSPDHGVQPPSPPPSPPAPNSKHARQSNTKLNSLDFPPLDKVFDASDPAEQLRAHPDVISAIGKIVAAAGQLAITVQSPFFALLDASFMVCMPLILFITTLIHGFSTIYHHV